MTKRTPVPPSEWRWQGYAGHFIAARDCQFRLTTIVGGYIVSTVGDYHPPTFDPKSREIAPSRKPQEIGYRRAYETMVFRAKPADGCACMEADDAEDLDDCGYNDHSAATEGHLEMCRKWAAIE